MIGVTVSGLVLGGLGIFVVGYFTGWLHASHQARRAFHSWLDANVGNVVRSMHRRG